MRAFSLFSGIGGFDLALQRTGHELVGACEIDKYARSVYARRFPNVKLWQNATTIDPKDIPDFDIMCAGFPCQAFSIAGQRGGFEDTRGSLFFEIARIVKEKLPSVLLLENVRGLLNHDKGQTFATILAVLEGMGYKNLRWFILNSKDFGVPQNRERVFIVGHLGNGCAREVLSVRGNDQETNGSQIEMIKDSTDDTYRLYSTDGVARTLRANAGGMGAKTGLYATTISSTQDHATVMTETSPALNCKHEQIMVYTSQINQNMKQRVQKRHTTWTLGTTSQRDFGLLDGTRIRRLTPVECERLQGFPDGWTEGHSDTQRYKMCGNAVTVPVVEYILRYLL